MNKFHLIIFSALFVMVVCISCDKVNNEKYVKVSPYIAGLTTVNYPSVDGSTSTEPLNMIIACKLFNIGYQWAYKSDGRGIEPMNKSNKLWGRIKSSQTHNSFINIIDKKADLILSARKMSPVEKTYAENKGVRLIETPIALDAFIIIVNPYNTILSLTTKQIQDIYTGKATYWYEVGGNLTLSVLSEVGEKEDGVPAPITPFVRNSNSGSQELFESFVMKDLNIPEFPVNAPNFLYSMAGAFDKVFNDITSICYTVYYYKEKIVKRGFTVHTVAVNGIYPTRETISNMSYPYTAEVYAVIRSDLAESSMAYKLYEWLQTDAGKQVISESGYIPN